MNGSASIQESNTLSNHSIGLLKRDVVPRNDIRELYGMASILEHLGKPIKRGKRISGTKMSMFGLFANAQLGW